MKLSKAQQKMVDKMREGAIIYQNMYTGRIWIRDQSGRTSDVNANTYTALRRRRIIISAGSENGNDHFKLTEQFKNEPK